MEKTFYRRWKYGNIESFFYVKRIVLSLLTFTLFFVSKMEAQYSVQYMHVSPLKFEINDLNRVQISSQKDKTLVWVSYKFFDERSSKIFQLDFPQVVLNRGNNNLSTAQGNLVWENSPYREYILKNNLYFGIYKLCVEIRDVSETVPNYDECFDIELDAKDITDHLNANPIELQYPENRDTIDDLKPTLRWIPPSPLHPKTLYHILLVPKRENQTCVEALNMNVPITDKKSIDKNILLYSAESPPLLKGSTYCWRASAYAMEKEYSRSEAWEFVVKGQVLNNSIPIINEIIEHIMYNVKGEFKFALNVKSSNIDLKYNIVNEENKIIRSHEEYPIKLKFGTNYLVLDELDFIKNVIYTFRILNIDDRILEFNFVIK